MSVLCAEELEGLHSVADAIRDEVEGNLHTIQKTLDLHPAYGETEHIASALVRSLVIHGARSRGRRVGLPLSTTFSGCDLAWSDERVYRRYRVKKATRNDSSGEFEMLVGATSGLLKPDPYDMDSVFQVEQWVLGYTVTPLRTINEVFVADVLGSTNSKVGHLVLGTPILLGRTTTPTDGGRFVSDVEDELPGFDEDGLLGLSIVSGTLG